MKHFMPILATLLRCIEAFMCANVAILLNRHQFVKASFCGAGALTIGFCLWEVYKHIKPHSVVAQG